VGLDRALDLRDVQAELTLPIREALLADRREVLATLDLLLAQLEIGFEHGLSCLEVVLALLELASLLAEPPLEVGCTLPTPLEALPRLEERRLGTDPRLQRVEPVPPRSQRRLGGRETGLAFRELAQPAVVTLDGRPAPFRSPRAGKGLLHRRPCR
jgi:hypothetical protein